MSSQPPVRVCDVVGCGSCSVGTYLDARCSPAVTFRVCTKHREQLAAGAEPLIVNQPLGAGEVHGRPALLLE